MYCEKEMNNDWAIKIEHLSKVYKIFEKPTDRVKEALNPFKKRYSKDFYALNDVSLTIKKGETVGIIGKNGAGKSTLLKIITGVLTPTAGSIQVKGRIASLLELGAGFNPEMSGIGNIYMNGTIMGYSKEEMDKRLHDIVKFADIGDFINQPVKMYSSGMFARLAFAVNAFVEPDILIVDEALSVGDIGFQSKCYRKIEELRSKGVTILLVTHDLGSVLQFCNYAVLLANGCKSAEGGPREIVDIFKKGMSSDVIQKKTKLISQQQNNNDDPWKSNYVINDSFLEYGDKTLEIEDFKIVNSSGMLTSTIKNDEDVTISVKIKVKKTVNAPIVAFSIKDVKGTELVGTNTLLNDINMGTFYAGNSYILSFKQRIPLRSGQYTLSFGCTKYVNEDLHIYHRLYDVVVLDILSDRKTAGWVYIAPTITLENEEIVA